MFNYFKTFFISKFELFQNWKYRLFQISNHFQNIVSFQDIKYSVVSYFYNIEIFQKVKCFQNSAEKENISNILNHFKMLN